MATAPPSQKEGTVSPKSPRARSVIRAATWAAGVTSIAAVAGISLWIGGIAGISPWLARLAVFAAVTTLPQYLVDALSWAAERVADGELPDVPIHHGYANLGAWVGLIERPLLLGSLVGGFPEFVAGWYVLKGIAGYRLGLDKKQVQERRVFQLFLINNGVSFAGVALGWLLWKLLGFPVTAA